MKYLFGIVLLSIFSCGNKEDVLLPKANETIVKEVKDLSPIYMFFRVEDKDTLTEVNRSNSISTTNWILNIDKRLPLRLVIPEVIKLQEKKRGDSAHKNEAAQNYYSYADTVGKNLAFLPFTDVFYTIGEPSEKDMVIKITKGSNMVVVDEELVKKSEVVDYVYGLDHMLKPNISLLFDKNMSYGEYIQTKILLRKLNTFTTEVPKEFIY
ncbi:hypothetical protein [Flavobacterium adhaerens]|uniref:hypothetical protein n=1 Tax=Flavobacterium adhaerens TaxID=3149043 RepID=UPI0032B340D9